MGTSCVTPRFVDLIAEDPILRDVKLIAEAWDVCGVGWNGMAVFVTMCAASRSATRA
jgi:pullulanase/glycogen debranching enzyme